MAKPLVSVVIPTKNSSRYLDLVLQTVKNQTYKRIEIVVVDNHSVDETKEIAKQYTKRVYDRGPERNIQKNFGASLARGKYLLFLDSDCELESRVVEECVDLCERDQDGVMIPLRHKGKGFWTKAKALERRCYDGDDELESPWFMRKSAFKKVGGFDKTIVAGEDWDIAFRLRKAGFKLGRNKSVIHHNLGKYTLREVIKSKFYYGEKIISYLAKKPANINRQLPFLRRAYLKNWRLLLRHPHLTLGFMFLKLLESLAVLSGIISVKVVKEER